MENIPKKIHYIWFGNNQKSDLIKKCIESWKKYLPDWEIIEWNESNYDVNANEYIRDAYRCKKYAFVADYARFDILYNYGGVYLDTDVELLQPIPNEMLENDGFSGVEFNRKIAPGLIFACKKNNSIVKEILKEYSKQKFIDNGKMNLKTVVDYTTEIFQRHGFKCDNTKQNINNFVIYPYEIFCAFNMDIKEFEINKNTISIHHYLASWSSNFKKNINRIRLMIKKIVGIKNYKKLIDLKRKIFNIFRKEKKCLRK